ncbi:SCP2 sterol-binding domain-containing protein [Undibacterium griseum]|uniref:SCP2 sterol-binding domain-containing protein n=1 Tax=Undibacterium griseum TaxID=2762295 RepID=A0ABR6YR14_9BURK|nr:SCP2 sterol-binding domain-containing protein [Undibacterium griseum]MBC3886332.1 SCP2 sterol-binding domain-containing protein [Undibacterium griseum]
MDLQACTEAIRTKVGNDSGLNSTLKFDCGSDGVVFVDALTAPNSVSNDNKDAACTITISLENLGALLTGQLNPMNGFMMGKLKVAGDMGVAMRLQTVV